MSWPQRVTAYPVEVYEPSIGRTAVAGSASVGAMPHATQRIMIVDPARRWYGTIMDRLNALCALPKGWDGYQAVPVSFMNATFALRMLEWTCVSDVPSPSIVPGPNGDLQVEWHLERGDIELHVRGPNDVSAWRLTESSGEDGEEVHLTNDFTLLSRWIKDLVEPSSAAEASAA